MHHLNRYFALLALFCLSASAAAAPRWEIDEAQLPPGLTKEKALKMLDDIDKLSAKDRDQEEAAQKRRAERAQKAARKYEDQFAKAIDKDPELRALQDKLKAGGEALKNPGLTDAEREARMQNMASDVDNLRQKGLARAGIDTQSMYAEIGAALNDGVASRGVDDTSSNEMLQERDGAFYYVAPDDTAALPDSDVESRSLKSSMLATNSGTTVKYLGAPWANGEVADEIGGVSGVRPTVGDYGVAGVVVFVGAGTNRRGLAHFLTVPSGISKIRVTAQMPETYFSSSAMAIGPGGGQSRTSSLIEVWDGGSKRLCHSYTIHSDVWGFVAALFTKSGTQNLVIDCTFAAPAAGRDIVIKFVSDAFAQAWGLGYGFGNVRAAPNNIRVELIK